MPVKVLRLIDIDKQMIDYLLNQNGNLHDGRAGELARDFADAALSIRAINVTSVASGLTRSDIAFAFAGAMWASIRSGCFYCQFNQPVSAMCAIVSDPNAYPSTAARLARNIDSMVDLNARQQAAFDRAHDIAVELLETAENTCSADHAAKKVRNRSVPQGKGCAVVVILVLSFSIAVTATTLAFAN